MKRNTLLEYLVTAPFECYYQRNGISCEYEGSTDVLYQLVANPRTKIQEMAIYGEKLSVKITAPTINMVIMIRFV